MFDELVKLVQDHVGNELAGQAANGQAHAGRGRSISQARLCSLLPASAAQAKRRRAMSAMLSFDARALAELSSRLEGFAKQAARWGQWLEGRQGGYATMGIRDAA